MGDTATTVFPNVREHYAKNITDLWFQVDDKTSPIMTGMEARKGESDGMGRGFVVPIVYTTGSAINPTFADGQNKAQSTASGNSAARSRWVIQPVTVDGFGYWDRDAMLAAESKGAGETFDLIERKMIEVTAGFKKRLATMSVEAGYGRVGTITAASSATTFTISSSMVNRLDIGDDVVCAAAEASGALRTGTGLVTQIDPDTGVVTVSGVDPSAQSWGVGDTIFYSGYRNTTTPLCPYGLRAWVPATAPTSTTFCEVNRQGAYQLGGLRLNAATYGDHAAAFIAGANRLAKYGTKADAIYCSMEDYSILCADKDATKQVQIGVGKYEIAFSGVSVQTLAGDCPVIPDAMLEQGEAIMGPWKNKDYAPYFIHNMDLINVDDLDGNQFLRAATSRNYEMRMFFRGNIVLPAPGKFLRIYGLPTA